MIKELGVVCRQCNNLVTKDIKFCECGNVAVRGVDFSPTGMVLYVSDTTTVDLVDVYINEVDNRIAKYKGRPSVEFGKAFFIKKETDGHNDIG